MRIPRIYLPIDLSASQSTELSEHAFQHAIKVLRLKQHAPLILFDGLGNECHASIETINKKNAIVKIGKQVVNKTESKLRIHLGLGISKGERMDYAIQKAVELGVTEITPLFTEHCVVNLDDKRSQKRLEHWRGVIISACEQCGRNQLPILHDANQLISWADTQHTLCLILDPQAHDTFSAYKPDNNKINVLVGPEGGLSANEISGLSVKDHCHTVRFGPRILRTETAAVSAITAMQLLWGDLLE